MSNLFCSSVCVPTAFKGTSPSYLNCSKVCPLGLFDLYLQGFFFFFLYWSSLHFATGSLADLPLVVAVGFTLPRNGAKAVVRGLIPSCHSCIPQPTHPCLTLLPPKAPLVPISPRGPSSGTHLHCPPSLPTPAIFPGHHLKPVQVLCSNCHLQSIHTPKQSSPNNHKSSAAQAIPVPCSSTLPASHPDPQPQHCQVFQSNPPSLLLNTLNLFSYHDGRKKQNILSSVLLKFSANKNTPCFSSLFSLPIFGWVMPQLSKTPCCIPCSADCLLKKSLYLHGHIMAIFSEPVIPVILLVFGIKNNGKRIKRILLNVTVVTCCLQNSRWNSPSPRANGDMNINNIHVIIAVRLTLSFPLNAPLGPILW